MSTVGLGELIHSVLGFVESIDDAEELEIAQKAVTKIFKSRRKQVLQQLSNTHGECHNNDDEDIHYENEELISSIRMDLKSRLPHTGCAPEEVFVNPECPASSASVASVASEGDEGGYENENQQIRRGTLTVDNFLVNELEFEHMQDIKLLPVSRCIDCGSYKVEDVNYISHSYSLEDLRNLFTKFLPDLTGKTVVDVGSRLGAVLYSGFCFSRASKVVGIEFNKYFCDLQNEMIDKYNLGSRVSVVCADVRSQEELLRQADVVIFNNVFEYFLKAKEMPALWRFLRKSLNRPGTIVLSSPPLEQLVHGHNGEGSEDFVGLLNGWLKYEKLTDAENFTSITAMYVVE
eukprot:TRINITY_DN4896_c0_g1_i1.p1 TRINITY_DN4896_c0_g1~~TRINITY_DN4896_c0_g1_i1.p1  ORF type:complete len:347 (-),score=114.33 TRINITY_DN4896_c0_g1_i1:33-1073(-)